MFRFGQQLPLLADDLLQLDNQGVLSVQPLDDFAGLQHRVAAKNRRQNILVVGLVHDTPRLAKALPIRLDRHIVETIAHVVHGKLNLTTA